MHTFIYSPNIKRALRRYWEIVFKRFPASGTTFRSVISRDEASYCCLLVMINAQVAVDMATRQLMWHLDRWYMNSILHYHHSNIHS